MQSWPRPSVPRLPGSGHPLRLRDTATGEIRPTAPGPTASMYVCGITPYDATHLGHAATYLTFDLVHRVWLDSGHQVRYVQNVTDVDDPLLERAEQRGEDWRQLAAREIELFRVDMQMLRILPPEQYVGAVETVDEVAVAVGQLLELGAAYRLEEDVYFAIDAAPRFGYESGLDQPTMLALSGERGGDPQRPGKKHPLDPLLWRGARPGEPSWPSPLGAGRPGWHIECAVIARNRLGDLIDVQGGGADLIFPHHEMSAAHAECLSGQWPFARHYVHSGMMCLDGAKMSKSRGNLVFVSRLRDDGVTGAELRLALLADHYAAERGWSEEALRRARRRLAAWRAAVAAPAAPDGDRLLAAVRSALADDLDTPAALAALDHWAAQAVTRGGPDPHAPALAGALVDALLGIQL